MIGYAVPYLSRCQAVLVDVSYTGESFVNRVKGLIGAVLRLLSVVSCTSLWFFLGVGLLSVRLVGLKAIVCCGKIVNENSNTLQATKLAFISLLLRRY
jgi:hypothetical protein